MKEEESSSDEPNPEKSEAETKRKLARPPKDKREVTIGPTTSTGPDITVG